MVSIKLRFGRAAFIDGLKEPQPPMSGNGPAMWGYTHVIRPEQWAGETRARIEEDCRQLSTEAFGEKRMKDRDFLQNFRWPWIKGAGKKGHLPDDILFRAKTKME